MKRAKIIGAGVLALLVLIVILQNSGAAETKILFITITMPRAILLIVTMLIGFLLGIITAVALAKRRSG